MYELTILGILMRMPAHGYLIAKIINNMIGPAARLSNGRLYPLLAKLEESGLIITQIEEVPASQGERHLRTYVITADGKKRFHALMMDTTSNPGEYQRLFLQKVCIFDCIEVEERLRLIEHYSNYCQAHVLHLTGVAEHMQNLADQGLKTPEQFRSSQRVNKHSLKQWQLEYDWAQSLRVEELALLRNRDRESIYHEKK